jgi:hypothetical protein
MANSQQPAEEFNTWPEIAGYLCISVREAQYREKSDGMPVHRMRGKKPRVFAYRSELDAWKRKAGAVDVAALPAIPTDRFRSLEEYLAPVLSGQPEPEAGPSDKGVPVATESPEPLDGSRENKNLHQRDAQALVPSQPTNRISRRDALVVTGLTLSGIAATGVAIRRWHFREIAMLGVEGPILIARDGRGNEMWRHPFRDGLFSDYYDPPKVTGTYWVGDLDGDGHAEALFRYDGIDRAAHSSSLFCFSRTGEVKWVFRPGHEVRDAGGEILPLYHITAVLVCFAPGPQRRARVAVTSVHPTDQASQLALLDASGRLTAEYWHPGHLYLLAESRAGFGGAPRILAGGVNNGEHRATLVVFNPFAMSGAMTPQLMRDQRFRLLDMPEAHEELVVLFPRTCLSRDEPYTRVATLEADGQAVRVHVAESHEMSKRTVYYDFDPSLTLRRAFLSTEYRQEHFRLEQSGALSHSANDDEAQLGRDLEIRRKIP